MEKLLTLPTKKPYEWPHIVLPEARQSLISRIESLSARETQDLLIQYAGVDFSRPDEKTNTIEMMMLYQHSLRIMGHNLSIDGIYGRKTREAIMKFQRQNKLTSDGIPGIKTTEKILSQLSEKSETTNPMADVVKSMEITPDDNKNVVRIVKEARKNPLPGSNEYSSYVGSNFDNIDYAYVRQSNGRYYVFGERSSDTPQWRNVYLIDKDFNLTDKDFNILWVARVEGDGKIYPLKWKNFQAPFNPSPIIKKK